MYYWRILMKRLPLCIWTVFFLGMLTYSGFFLFQRDKLAADYGWPDFPVIAGVLLGIVLLASIFSLLIHRLLGRRHSILASVFGALLSSVLTSLVMVVGMAFYVLCVYQLWIILVFDLLFVILMFAQMPEEA